MKDAPFNKDKNMRLKCCKAEVKVIHSSEDNIYYLLEGEKPIHKYIKISYCPLCGEKFKNIMEQDNDKQLNLFNSPSYISPDCECSDCVPK